MALDRLGVTAVPLVRRDAPLAARAPIAHSMPQEADGVKNGVKFVIDQ
jgi:hypothetical protein